MAISPWLECSKTILIYARWGCASFHTFHIFFNASLILRERSLWIFGNVSLKKMPLQKLFNWEHLSSCVPFFAATFGLYFPRKEYSENVYMDQPAGTPLLRIHALRDSHGEVARFHLCQNLIISRARSLANNWFQIREKTGLLYLSKSLDREDFNMLRKYGKTGLSCLLNQSTFRSWGLSISIQAWNLEKTHLPFLKWETRPSETRSKCNEPYAKASADLIWLLALWTQYGGKVALLDIFFSALLSCISHSFTLRSAVCSSTNANQANSTVLILGV